MTVNHYKVNHRLQHPDFLDLTNHQLHDTFPLHYRLSSVISHTGPGVQEGAGGHYIASVRDPGASQFTCILDRSTEAISHAQFLRSPQRKSQFPGNFQVYILTYVREEVPLITKAQLAAIASM